MSHRRKPKIVILVPRYGLVERGTENFTREFIAHMADSFEVTVLSRVKITGTMSIWSMPASSKILQSFYSLHPRLAHFLDRFYLSPDHLEMLTFSIAVLPHLLTTRYDLLFPQNGVWGALVCRLVRAIKKVPFVYRSAGGIEPMIARQKPDIYFTINPAIARWLRRHFPQLRVVFVSNGVNLTHFSPHGKKARVKLPRPIIMTSAALIPGKRVDLTITAVGKLKKGSLMVLGEGPLKKELTMLAEQQIGRGNFLFKKVSYPELPEYYRVADVFAFAAPDELGWGLVHLEALAAGLPVVANREENLEFLMGKNAHLCDVRDPDEYSQTIGKALKSRTSLRQRVIRYSWDKTSERYKKYFTQILENYAR